MYQSSRLFLFTAIFVIINIFSSMFYTRLDLTQGQIYTLSASTKKIIEELPSGIEILAFVTEDFPAQYVTSQTQLNDKLDEYNRLSGGKLTISYKDPAKDTETEKLASSFGIPSLDLQSVVKDQVQIKKAYFGLAVVKDATSTKENSSSPLDKYEKYEVLPVVSSLDTLEYDLASMLLKVGSDSLPKIGFLTGHGEHTFEPQNQYTGMTTSDPRADYPLQSELSRNYEIKMIDLSVENNDSSDSDPLGEIKTLIIAGPTQSIPDDQAEKIHDYIKNGGNAIMLIDGFNINTQYGLLASSLPISFDNLLSPYGVSIEPQVIADANSGMATFNQGYMSYSIPYPFFIKVTNLNRDNSITRDLESFILPWTSPLKYDNSDQITTLATSSEYIQLLSETDVTTSGESTDAAPATQKEPISLDPNQDFNISSSKQTPAKLIAEINSNDGSGKVIIAGDSDFVVQGGENSVLFMNMIDSLSLGDDLIQIRSKAVTDRPLKDLSETEKNSIRWGLIICVPLVFVIYGFYRRWQRNKHKSIII